MGGGDHTGIGAFWFLPTHGVVLVVFENPQELTLKLRSGVPDFVQEDRAAAGQGEAASVVAHSAGKLFSPKSSDSRRVGAKAVQFTGMKGSAASEELK